MQGNLSEFVKVKPEAKAYYELAAASLRFIFPKPGMLVGVSSKDREIVNMKGVSFRYLHSLSRGSCSSTFCGASLGNLT